MRILAIETATTRGSVAVCDEQGGHLEQLPLPFDGGAGATLAPSIAGILDHAGWTPQQVDLVAVSIGPGSFTGLRVGVTTAKTFAYAVQAHVAPVSTLRAVARQGPVGLLAPALDAQRGQVYTAFYQRSESGATLEVDAPVILDVAEWIERLNRRGAIATGPVLRRLLESAPENGPSGVGLALEDERTAPADCWWPQASAVALLAAHDVREGAIGVSPFDALPFYLRLSAAEEKRNRAIRNRSSDTGKRG